MAAGAYLINYTCLQALVNMMERLKHGVLLLKHAWRISAYNHKTWCITAYSYITQLVHIEI